MTPLGAIFAAWLLWFASWLIAARWASPAVARASKSDLPARLVIAAGAVLVGAAARGGDLRNAAGWAMLGLALAGFAFAWWARLHLGRLWAAGTVRKQGHRIVASGPYAIVRHPIYTGVIAAIWATALVQNRWTALLGAALFAIGFGLKARNEEIFLGQELGRDNYDSYARRVPMLIPLWPRKR